MRNFGEHGELRLLHPFSLETQPSYLCVLIYLLVDLGTNHFRKPQD